MGVDWVLRGTLLEWIDHYFAKPNNPDERTLGKYENIYACLHMVPEKFWGHMTIKTFGVKRWSFGTKNFRDKSAEPDTTNLFYMPDSSGNRL